MDLFSDVIDQETLDKLPPDVVDSILQMLEKAGY
jgi:hypothetical protein